MRDASLCYRELATRVRQHKLGKRSRRRGSIKPMTPEAARSCWESSLKLLAHVEMLQPTDVATRRLVERAAMKDRYVNSV